MFDDWRVGFVMVKEWCFGDNNWSFCSMNVFIENWIKVLGFGNGGYVFDVI